MVAKVAKVAKVSQELKFSPGAGLKWKRIEIRTLSRKSKYCPA